MTRAEPRAGNGQCRHSQAAVNATSVRNTQRICSANCDQRSDGVPPSSRAGSNRRRHSQAAVNAAGAHCNNAPRQIADSVTKACPHQAAHASASRTLCDKRSQCSVFARQIANSAAMACPHQAAQPAVAAGICKPHPVRQVRVMQRICSANRGQRSDSVPPSSRAGSSRRRHSQAAANTGRRSQCTAHLPGKLQTAQRWRAPIEPRTGIRFPLPLHPRKAATKTRPSRRRRVLCALQHFHTV